MCNGRGAVLRWIDVMAEFKTHSIVNVIERGGLNKEYLKLLEGRQMYKWVMFGGFMIRVQGWRLVEGDSFYDSEVNESIHDLLQQAECVLGLIDSWKHSMKSLVFNSNCVFQLSLFASCIVRVTTISLMSLYLIWIARSTVQIILYKRVVCGRIWCPSVQFNSSVCLILSRKHGCLF